MRVAKYITRTVVLPDHPVTRHALKECEKLWKANGRPEGVTITSGKDGVHGAGSWHPIGAAFDCRTKYWPIHKRKAVYKTLNSILVNYDVVWHDDHIHVEPSNTFAKKWGLML